MSLDSKTSYEDHTSLSSFHTQNTKKGISTEDIIIQQDHPRSALHGKASMHTYSIHLPSGLSINKIVTSLKDSLVHDVLYYDEDKGQLLLQGQKKFSCWDLLDCCAIFRMQGTSKGSLAHCYSVIAIRVTQQIIEQRCTITIKPSHPKQKDQYYSNVLRIVQAQVKKFSNQPQNYSNKVKGLGLEENSPLQRQIQAYKTVYDLFLCSSQTDKRYATLHNKSMQKIHHIINKYHNQQASNPKSKFRVSDLTEAIINETNSLYTAYTYDQTVNIHPQYCIYAIQSSICIKDYTLSKIQEIYSLMMSQQNNAFNHQCQIINNQFSNKQCFDYLQCKKKYRLPKQTQPYFLAIMALREISFANSIRQMLLSIQKCFSQAKVCCLVEHGGNVQLATMDDILPVMIYIVARAAVWNFPTLVKIIDDYIRIKGVFELEERVITTLYVAVEDITKKWASLSSQTEMKQEQKKIVEQPSEQKQKIELQKQVKIQKNIEVINEAMLQSCDNFGQQLNDQHTDKQTLFHKNQQSK